MARDSTIDAVMRSIVERLTRGRTEQCLSLYGIQRLLRPSAVRRADSTDDKARAERLETELFEEAQKLYLQSLGINTENTSGDAEDAQCTDEEADELLRALGFDPERLAVTVGVAVGKLCDEKRIPFRGKSTEFIARQRAQQESDDDGRRHGNRCLRCSKLAVVLSNAKRFAVLKDYEDLRGVFSAVSGISMRELSHLKDTKRVYALVALLYLISPHKDGDENAARGLAEYLVSGSFVDRTKTV